MKQEKVRADLHNHLHTFTIAIEGDFDKAVDKACEKLGTGGVLGLVNFADTRYESYIGQRSIYDRNNLGNAIYVPEKDILVVKGQEIQTKEGHLLVLALEKDKHLRSSRQVTLEDAIKEAQDHNGIIVADHPLYREGIGEYLQRNPKLIESLDAFELNGEAVWIPGLAPKQANKKLIAFYEQITNADFPDLGIIANSDGHSFHEIGNCYTLIKQPDTKNSETLISTLRAAVKSSFLKDVHLQSSTIGAYEHLIKLIPLILAAKLHLVKIKNPRGESHT